MFLACQGPSVKDLLPENTFTPGMEGPAVDKDGNLYAVNYAEQGTIGVVTPDGRAKTFVTLPKGSIGNGIRFGADGTMYIADYTGHNVLRVAPGSQEVTVYAHNPEMSQPNDLAIAPNGTIYLSDPNWKAGTGTLYYVTADRQIKVLQDGMGTVNGIEVSPDGRFLYVGESEQRKVWHFTIGPDGQVTQKTLFLSFPDFGLDGMRCDAKGNLYITRYGKGTVLIVSPTGKTLKEIPLKGKKPSNIAFGGPKGKTCYVTLADRGCFEYFTALNPGRFYAQIHTLQP